MNHYIEALEQAIIDWPVNKAPNAWWDLSFVESCEENIRLYREWKGRLC